jgi:uncharacterized membrane protein YagU involved in acid resistance
MKHELVREMLIGVAAGVAATWVMDQATTVLYEHEPEEAKKRENAARGQRTAYEIAAEESARLAGFELDEEQRKMAGAAMHWAIGAAAGAGYGVLRSTSPYVRAGSGLAYGTLFWLAMDEGALTLLGLTPPPKEFPWQTHARGLAGHLVLGGVIEAVFAVTDQLHD